MLTITAFRVRIYRSEWFKKVERKKLPSESARKSFSTDVFLFRILGITCLAQKSYTFPVRKALTHTIPQKGKWKRFMTFEINIKRMYIRVTYSNLFGHETSKESLFITRRWSRVYASIFHREKFTDPRGEAG